MADKSLLELPLAVTGAGALLYGVQDNADKAFPVSVLVGGDNPQPANTVYAGPTAPPGNFPTFRPLVANDIPDLSAVYMAASGGNLANATLNNSTILGGTISGATAVFDEDKFTLRDTLDTTRNGKFDVNLPATATSVTWSLPGATTTLVGRDTADTLTNKKVLLDASSTASAALRVTPGQPPSAPVNGDVWTTNAGMFAQINNTTVGPFAAASSSTVASWNGRVGAVTMGTADVTTALGYTPYNPAEGAYLPLAGGTMFGHITSNSDITSTGVIQGGGGGGKDRIRIINADATAAASLQAVNNTASDFAPLNLRGSVINSAGAWTHSSSLISAGPISSLSYSSAVSTGGGAFYAECGALSTQSAAYNIRQSGNRLWSIGVESDRSFKIWAYGDDGNYIGERLQISRSGAMTVNGGILSQSVETGNIAVREQGGGAVVMYSSSGGVGRYFTNHDDTNWRLNTMDNNGQYTGTPIRVERSTANVAFGNIITAVGGFGPGSDPRLKVTESLQVVDNALDTLYNLNVRRGKYHDWYNPDGKDRYFVMADESMEEAAPEVVMRDAIETDGVHYNGWSSDQMIALLVKSVQELKDEVTTLKEKIHELSN